MACTSHSVDDVSSQHEASKPESSTMLYFNEVHQMAAPFRYQTIGRVYQNVWHGEQSLLSMMALLLLLFSLLGHVADIT